ncbi:hypothetical protein WA026_002718 [Henosepilachna vigintioctopunctata]|uniref:Transposase n=1 Tax=Henosepilachna vigintioctopunctata TaxID=420089 RepID=A0AAW1U1I6_9CUCU
MSKSTITKFRTNYDPDFKSVVVKYAIQTSNKTASDRFGINESNVRRWKRLYMREKEELYENPLARRPATSKRVGRRRRNSGRSRRKRRKSATYTQENSSDIAINCSKRWAYIRDYYIRRRGKQGTGSSGEAAKKRSNLLSFLDRYSSIKRSTTSNMSDIYEGTEELVESNNATSGENQNEESWEVTENIKEEEPELESQVQRVETPRISHSQERLHLLKQIVERQFSTAEGEDETDLFFSSMAKIVKGFHLGNVQRFGWKYPL